MMLLLLVPADSPEGSTTLLRPDIEVNDVIGRSRGSLPHFLTSKETKLSDGHDNSSQLELMGLEVTRFELLVVELIGGLMGGELMGGGLMGLERMWLELLVAEKISEDNFPVSRYIFRFPRKRRPTAQWYLFIPSKEAEFSEDCDEASSSRLELIGADMASWTAGS